MTNAANHYMEVEYDGEDPFITWTCLHEESETGCSLVEGVESLGSKYFFEQISSDIFTSGDVYLWWEYEGTDWESGLKDYSVGMEYADK